MSLLDENTMRELFEELDAPAVVDDRWRTAAALATLAPPGEGRAVTIRVEPPKPVRPWVRVAAVGAAMLATVGVIVGVAASNRLPPTNPQPDIIQTITQAPTTRSTPSSPPPSSESAAGSVEPSLPGGQAPPVGPPPAAGPGTTTGKPVPVPTIPPARGPLTEWPDQINTGVPPSTVLRSHPGDLHVTTPGAIVYDLRVDGTIFVEAPDVTVRRVQGGAVRQQAPRLTIEDSQFADVRQDAPGLTVRRGDVSSVASAANQSDTTVVDTFIWRVRVTGTNTRVTLRHNTFGDAITLDDAAGPVADVTIENNRLPGSGTSVWAPAGSGSRDIHILNNRFSGTSGRPVNGYNPQAPGNTWVGNVWDSTNEPVNP